MRIGPPQIGKNRIENNWIFFFGNDFDIIYRCAMCQATNNRKQQIYGMFRFYDK